MDKVATRKASSHRAAKEISLSQERGALLRRGYGAWRGKSRAGDLRTRQIPRALAQAAGLLKGKLKKTPLQYQKALRKEW